MNRILAPWMLLALIGAATDAAERTIPIVYSTDLFHPHQDPDDHYDLACLFALREFDVRGIILDLGATQAERPGRPAVEQMMHVSGRKVPFAFGLGRRFRQRTDKALDEPAEFQGGVELILSALRQPGDKVILFTTGSCRDVAAAYNREPELLKDRVKAVYFNIGRGPGEEQNECNVGYDPAAYLRLFESGLPIYWCPCFGKDGYQTLYVADQATVVGACATPVQNFFVYCLTRSTAEAIPFLAGGPHPLPTGPRSMWCTAPMFHAAGRRIYQRGPDDFVALGEQEARQAGLDGKPVDAYRFMAMHARIGDPESPSPAAAPLPEPGRLAAVYAGRSEDRVGTRNPEPDGREDCRVSVRGIASGKPIRNLVLTGPREGRWEHIATGRWWRVAYEQKGAQLDAWFQFYAPGEHQVEVVYSDGTTQSATFLVPDVGTMGLQVEVGSASPNGFVFRATDPRYAPILASCLKNLLAGLGR